MAVPATYSNPNAPLAAGGLEGATDDVVSATYWNRLAAIVYYLGGVGGYIGCRAQVALTQSIANATETAMALSAEGADSDPNGAIHDTVTNNSRVVCRTSGLYHISAWATFTANATGTRRIGVRINGGSYLSRDARPAPTEGGMEGDVACATAYPMSAGDYVEAMVYQSSGGALNVTSGALCLVKA